ncbi:CoA transferase [Candidatus Berkiella cookevillensis]|uniref:CoA transferase n=1 Tax=Candidatus Berkiella cookevillensis TaxID=437022 RepID=A0A0Q9YF03_9GAMM|nr:CaiB/BaiF CoA-transferase family protein [Candidatus Berkiella cookevillensis]MCS5709411.1 CoA transferase [Candidatus Berkiella cookevillensis]
MLEKIQQLFALAPQGPLNGYLVLEIGGNISGPMAGEELARRGALVVKIEMPGIGDPARSYLSPSIFTSCNASKASIVIDKHNEHDNQMYTELLSLADVVIDNRSPDAKHRDEILQRFLHNDKLNPIIFCSIVGYDSADYHDRPALDVAVQAETGMAMVNAASAHEPLKVGFVVVDTVTGLQAASSIKDHLLALQRGMRCDAHQKNVIFLEQSMAKTSALLMTGQYLQAYAQGKDAFREGNRDLWVAPFSFYKTKNGMISLAIIGDALFAIFCDKVLQQKELAEQYPTNQSRIENIAAFESILCARLAEKTSEEWIALCRQYNIVCSQVNTITQMLQQPFASQMIAKTQDGTAIIADSCTSSLYQSQLIQGAPNLDANKASLQALLAYRQQYDLSKRTFSDVKQQFDLQLNMRERAPQYTMRYQAQQRPPFVTPHVSNAQENARKMLLGMRAKL